MAEINYNNLYNQLKPMEQRYYDQQFSKNYVPGKENIMLSSQPAYEQMKAAYEAQQQVPETGFFDSIFGSASAAEPPAIPNLSYRNITPTFDLATGITNTKSASPFINTGKVYQNLLNTDLVNQLIQENQMKANVFSRPNMMNIAGTSLPGGITNIPTSINQQPFNDYYGPTNIDTSFGVANEEDVEEDVQGARQTGGLANLFRAALGFAVPGAGLLMNLGRGGLQGIQSLNQRLRNTTFGRSATLADYFQEKRDEKAREAARQRGIDKEMARSGTGRDITGSDFGGDFGQRAGGGEFSGTGPSSDITGTEGSF